MKTEDKIWLATKAAEKGWDYSTLRYSDDLYHVGSDEKEQLIDDIWEYVDEYKDGGSRAFREKYKQYKMY